MTTPVDLLGRWCLRRTIDDRLADETSRVTGTAVLSATGDGAVRWHEEGLLRRPGLAPTEVTRTLLVVPPEPGPDAAPWPWLVTFADGRPFHPWTPGVHVDHPCPPDHYRGRVALDLPAGWSVTWEVRGPAKRYTMSTTYRA